MNADTDPNLMIPRSAYRELNDKYDGLGRALQFTARERDLERRLYEAAMNWFDENEWRQFEEDCDEFHELEAEYKALRAEIVASLTKEGNGA